MNLINLTPHSLVFRNAAGEEWTIQSSGVARVSSTPGALTQVPGIPIPVAEATVYGAVEGLPPQSDGFGYVVSGLVLSALKGTRSDVFGPGTGPNDGAIRNDKGHIVAVTRLVRG